MDERLVKFGKGARDVLLPYVPHIAALAVVAAIGVLASLHAISQPVSAPETQDRWTLPQWQPYRAGTLRDEVLDAELWGDTPGAKSAKVEARAEAPPWRFVGTVQEGNKRVAVIEIEGLRIKRMAAGEELPNGARIEAVDIGALTYAESGANRTIKLFDTEKPNFSAAKGK